MKIELVLGVLLSLISLGASAGEPACPEAANMILRHYGLAQRVGSPAPNTKVSNHIAPNRMPYDLYEDATRNIRIAISQKSDTNWSWIEVNLGQEDDVDASRVGSRASDPSSKYIAIAYDNCKVSYLVSNRPVGQDHIVVQTTCGARFCRNLNAGRSLSRLDRIYLQFNDNSGNISADHEIETRQMCKELEPFLAQIAD